MQDWGNLAKAVVEQDQRRTGAGLFCCSGSVGDDPLIRVELADTCLYFS